MKSFITNFVIHFVIEMIIVLIVKKMEEYDETHEMGCAWYVIKILLYIAMAVVIIHLMMAVGFRD